MEKSKKQSLVDGEEVSSSVVHALEQRIAPLERQLSAMEGSIIDLQQSMTTLIQQLSGFNFVGHQPRMSK